MIIFPEPKSIKALSGRHKSKQWCLRTHQKVKPLFNEVWPVILQDHSVLNNIHLQESNSLTSIKVNYKASLKPDAYYLKITPNLIEMHLSSASGLLYAFQTLAQLLEQPKSTLPCLEIEDQPTLTHRGYMLDVSRCKVPTLRELKKLISQLSKLRFNHFELYIEHSFAFKNHVTVWGDSSPITHEEILELDQYCSERCIELVPNLNSFGHFERWLKHKGYQHLAESPEGFTSPFGDFRPVGSVLKPNKQSLNFIESLYQEYLPLFKSKNFNVGCDETFELGQGYSKKKVMAKGIHEVYFEHLLKIQKLVKRYKRNMWFWADILIESPETIKKLPKDITALIWGYEADHPFDQQCKILEQTKANYWVCPGSGAWNSLIGRLDHALDNINNAYQNGIQHQAKGLLLTDWGDGGHHQTAPITWPSLCYTANLTWSGQVLSHQKLSKFITTVFLHDDYQLASTLVKMGSMHKKLNAPIMNGNAYHHYLFDTKKLRTLSQKKLVTHCLELEQLKESLQAKTSTAAIEMMNGIDLCLLALKKQLHQHYGHEFSYRDSVKVIGEYESIWIQRNRIGGLHESSQKLREALLI